MDKAYDVYNGHMLFYVSIARLEGRDVTLITTDSTLRRGDVVATCGPVPRGEFARQYDLAVLDSTAQCATVEIRGGAP